MKQEQDMADESKNPVPKLDLGFKEGQTITINIGVRKEIWHILLHVHVCSHGTVIVLNFKFAKPRSYKDGASDNHKGSHRPKMRIQSFKLHVWQAVTLALANTWCNFKVNCIYSTWHITHSGTPAARTCAFCRYCVERSLAFTISLYSATWTYIVQFPSSSIIYLKFVVNCVMIICICSDCKGITCTCVCMCFCFYWNSLN